MPREPKKLGTYRGKRTAGLTNEPFGDEAVERDHGERSASARSSTESGAFVVHLHDATRRHYDVRLEIGGVLLSFAVPHGPSLDPAKKVLAVMTEDHPIEYLDFEDVIPAGQYGAGPMIVWDRGSVVYVEGPAEEELAQGKLHVELRGMKLRGLWAFVKLAKGETGSEWLLFKKQDAAADPSRALALELPRSVLSGLTVEEMEQREAIERSHVNRATSLGAKKQASLVGEFFDQPRSPLAVASPRDTATKSGRIYDAELDGIRVLAVRDGDVVTLRMWTGESSERVEAFYPDVVRALRALPMTRAAFDGELVAFDATGHPSLPLLAQRVARLAQGDAHRAVTTTPVVLVVNDVLALADLDVRPLKLEARRRIIADLLPPIGFLRAAAPLEGDEARVLATCASLGITGVIAKSKGSPYTEGTGSWTWLSTGVAPRARSAVDHKAHDRRTTLRQVIVSNREKIFWPADPLAGLPAFTKGDLVDYYGSVAGVLGPYLKDRPVVLVRYPDGIDGKSFFQWNVPVGMPPWIRTLTLHDVDEAPLASGTPLSRPPPARASSPPPPSQKTPKRVFLVDDPSTLVYIANLGCIPLHVLASRAPDLSRADFATIDFDVKQSELRHAVTLARTLHELLDEIGLAGFPKTSGQTGLHVLVPLGPNQSFDTARALADLLGRLLVERHPDLATMDRMVSRRGDRVYVDTGQTGTSRAIVAPYSVRAVPGATVSTPLSWDEVAPDLDPRAFTIKTVPERIAKRGDLFKGLLDAKPDVLKAVTRLADVVPRSLRRPR
ncbi:MAG: ATP-dependent ligase [Labilithrix sp.]|nr:ATP-dependent ligase [Labilithrix sp.]